MLRKLVRKPHIPGLLEAEGSQLGFEPGAGLRVGLAVELERIEHVVAARDDHLQARNADAGAHIASLGGQRLRRQRGVRCIPGKSGVAVVRHRIEVGARGPRRPLRGVMHDIASTDERRWRGSSQLRPVESHHVSQGSRRATFGEEPYQIALCGSIIDRGKAAQGGIMQVSEILKVKGNALFTVAPDGKVSEAVSVMAQHNMGSLVVMDKGRMVGILTFREILMILDKGRGALGESKVGEVMERDPVVASPGMDVNDLRRTMIDSGARYLPVMERDRLIGVISFRDVAKAVLEEQDFENRMLKGYIKNWPE